jgi:hypothetical protein
MAKWEPGIARIEMRNARLDGTTLKAKSLVFFIDDDPNLEPQPYQLVFDPRHLSSLITFGVVKKLKE